MRDVRIRDRNDGPSINAGCQCDIGRLHGERTAAMGMDVGAWMVVRWRPVLVIFVNRGVVANIDLMSQWAMMVMGRMHVRTVVSVGMQIKRRKHACIGVRAAGTDGDSNENEVQELACPVAHA